VASPQIANPQISTKYCTTLSQNNYEIRLSEGFFYVKIWNKALYAAFVRRKGMDLLICGSSKSANHKKLTFANPKSAKCHICGRSANLTNYLSPQSCWFAICGPKLFVIWGPPPLIYVHSTFQILIGTYKLRLQMSVSALYNYCCSICVWRIHI
jgi:hypothetical protein